MNTTLTLGAEYKDRITGFTGICTGETVYISGCNQALLQPKVGKDGNTREGHWFDVQRLEQVGSKVVVLNNSATPGCDIPAPKR